MTEPGALDPATARRRQYLLLGGIAAVIAGAALVSVLVTDSRAPDAKATKPRTTHILAPGAQVDPKDAWRGQADAQLKTIEQNSREVTQKSAELEKQNREMLERLRKLEQAGLTSLPPPPVAAPPARPNFGPDRPNGEPALAATNAQRLPPPPPPPPVRSGAPVTLPMSGTSPAAGIAPTPSGIVSITLADGAPAKGAKAAPESTKPAALRDTRRYLPSGSFARAVLLGGLDAPTGGQAQRNPQPVLLRLTDHAMLPNHFRGHVKECFVVGAGYGDVSSERAYIRTESLSCVTRDGTALDVPIKGYVAGEDGKAGMRGRLVSKQGQLLANALMAGVASGIGQAFQQNATTVSVSPLGSTSTVEPGKQLEAGLGSGVGKALDRLAQYYITLAEKVFPVIEVDAGRTVDVVVTQGLALPGALDADAHDRDELPQLAQRARPLTRNDDDDE